MQKAVQHIFKLAQQLYLVKNNIIRFFVFDTSFQVSKHLIRITQFLVAAVIQRDLNNMILGNAFFNQIIVKQIKQKIGLSASANVCNYFYQTVIFPTDQTVQIQISFYFHNAHISINIVFTPFFVIYYIKFP